MSDERLGLGLGYGLRRAFHGGLGSHGRIFLAGLALGPIAFKILTSKDARNFYTDVIAAGLRAKEYTMDTVNIAQEYIEDMIAEAKFINMLREEDEFYDEFGDCCCDEDCDCDCDCDDDDSADAK
ncbi:MAG: DUF6110 family protein [Eubacteriales bacterium]